MMQCFHLREISDVHKIIVFAVHMVKTFAEQTKKGKQYNYNATSKFKCSSHNTCYVLSYFL